MTYANLDQMQNMEFGVTGDVVVIDFVRFERVEDRNNPSLFGWAALYTDVNSNMVDWDRVSEDDAKMLGLIP